MKGLWDDQLGSVGKAGRPAEEETREGRQRGIYRGVLKPALLVGGNLFRPGLAADLGERKD